MTTACQKPTFFELARQCLSRTDRGYDLLAAKFESTAYATPMPWIEESLQRVDERFPIANPSQSQGADLACGTGRGSRALRRSCQKVDGFDFSAGMLREASRLSEGLTGMNWQEADLACLVLAPKSYDRIVTFGAWGHILPSFRGQLLRRILSALKPGGVFVTLTANEPEVWERRYWFSLVFDSLIWMRNRLWFQEFHMYYRLNSTQSLSRNLRVASRELVERCPEESLPELYLEPLTVCESSAITLVMLRRAGS